MNESSGSGGSAVVIASRKWKQRHAKALNARVLPRMDTNVRHESTEYTEETECLTDVGHRSEELVWK